MTTLGKDLWRLSVELGIDVILRGFRCANVISFFILRPLSQFDSLLGIAEIKNLKSGTVKVSHLSGNYRVSYLPAWNAI